MTDQTQQVRKRDMTFSCRTKTRIWQEIPSEENPYLAGQCRCHGYDIMELAGKRSFAEVLFLLFQGELPTLAQARMLEFLLIAMINPGPRHPATRAAMNAGVGKTTPVHILPIALTVLGGEHLGGQEVERAIRFFRKHLDSEPDEIAGTLLGQERPSVGDWHIAPGFGSRFGGVDQMPGSIVDMLLRQNGDWRALRWGKQLAMAMNAGGLGWLGTGVVAAALCDLGFAPQAGGGLFQLICAPGILAHGLELSNKPITAMPFLGEDHYVIEQPTREG